MSQPSTIAPGNLINHSRWGIGQVLNVEGTGHRAQVAIDFGDHVIWIVLAGAPITVVHNGSKE